MLMITRALEEILLNRLINSNKINILYGPRQVGKTTLAKQIIDRFGKKSLQINADRAEHIDTLSSRNLNQLKGLVDGYEVLFIDEAQRIPDIGINLKILHDELPNLKILVTGSSSLDLANRIKEPLTGRTWTYKLFPIAVEEWRSYMNINEFEFNNRKDEWLLYGSYPEILLTQNFNEKRSLLGELSSSYLYKDILSLTNIQYPEKLRQLLKMLSFQIGNLISIHELAITLQVNRDTIINYLDLLEKSFVIFRLGGFQRNLRKEVTKMDKIYFYDLGIRNALIENFNLLNVRNDIGAIWENFLIIEKIKSNTYREHFANLYFWKTHSGAELDYVEEKDGQLMGYEFKWKKKSVRPSKTWSNTYENSSFQLINRDNFYSFIQGKL